MTEMITAKEKYDFCQEAIKAESDARTIFLDLGEKLYLIREGNLWEGSWGSWNEFCMEFKDLSGGSISKLISVYALFILELGFTKEELAKVGSWTKLYSLTRFIKTKKDALEWLAKAETTTRTDLAREMTEYKTGIPMSKCKHEKNYVIRVCADCGYKWRDYRSDSKEYQDEKTELDKTVARLVV